MKALILSLGMLALTACGAGGGSSPAATSVNLPAPLVPVAPSCKALNSVWQSTTNHERHDLTNIPVQDAAHYNSDNSTWQSYAFMAGTTGERCPTLGQPQTAAMTNNVSFVLAAGFQTVMYLHNNYPSAACSTYQNPGQLSDGTTSGAIEMKLECNKLTMCRVYNDPATCTVFN